MEEQWTFFKDILRNLYLVQDLSLKEVARKMGEIYGFKATDGQYERHFKKWGFRKNLTAREWQFVARQLKRKRGDAEAEVAIDGIRVPTTKLRKQISRYGAGPRYDVEKAKIREITPPNGITFPATPVRLGPLSLRALPWTRFSRSALLKIRSHPELITGSGAVFSQQLAIPQKFTQAFIPMLSTTTCPPEPVDSTAYELLSAIFLASNNLMSSDREDSMVVASAEPAMSKFCGTFGSLAAIQMLVALKAEYNPTLDAFRELIFKEVLLSKNVKLAKVLLNQFKFDLDDPLPGPWWQEFVGFRSSYLANRDYVTARPPLQVAIESSNIELVKLLLGYGASANIPASSGCDMMMVAACTSSEAIIHALLRTFRKRLVPALLLCLRLNLNNCADILWAAMKDEENDLENILEEDEENDILFKATSCGHIEIMTSVLEFGAEVNTPDESDTSPLQTAVWSDDSSTQAISLLIEWGADVDYRVIEYDLTMPTPLQIAVFERKLDVVELLLGAGADPNAPGPAVFDRTIDLPYYDALGLATYGKSDCRRLIELLLEAGAKPTDQSLTAAVDTNSFDIIQLYLDTNAPLSIDVLFAAAEVGNADMVRRCLDAGFDVNHLRYSQSPLTMAARGPGNKGHYLDERTYIILLDNGADVNISGVQSSALEEALACDKIDLVSLLLERGSECNSGVLDIAVRIGDQILLNKFLDAVASHTDSNEAFTSGCLGHEALETAFIERNETMISILVQRGVNLRKACATRSFRPMSLPLMESLLAHGLPVNLKGCCEPGCCRGGSPKQHLQPVQQLTHTGDNDAVQLFLRYGANPNLLGHEEVVLYSGVWTHRSALGSAAEGGHISTVNVLLDAGSEVNQPALGRFGRTPLQSAAQSGHIDIVRRLLEKGANVNAKPAQDAGVTALQAAAIGGSINIAAELIEHEAQVNAPAAEIDGRTALEGACEYGRIDMVELLIKAGADLEGTQYSNAIDLAKTNGFNAVARFLRRRKEEMQMSEFVIFPTDTPSPSPM